MYKEIKAKKGQTTVECTIVIGAILGVLIVFLQPKGPFQNTIDSVLGSTTAEMEVMSTRLDLSRGTSLTATTQGRSGPGGGVATISLANP